MWSSLKKCLQLPCFLETAGKLEINKFYSVTTHHLFLEGHRPKGKHPLVMTCHAFYCPTPAMSRYEPPLLLNNRFTALSDKEQCWLRLRDAPVTRVSRCLLAEPWRGRRSEAEPGHTQRTQKDSQDHQRQESVRCHAGSPQRGGGEMQEAGGQGATDGGQ